MTAEKNKFPQVRVTAPVKFALELLKKRHFKYRYADIVQYLIFPLLQEDEKKLVATFVKKNFPCSDYDSETGQINFN